MEICNSLFDDRQYANYTCAFDESAAFHDRKQEVPSVDDLMNDIAMIEFLNSPYLLNHTSTRLKNTRTMNTADAGFKTTGIVAKPRAIPRLPRTPESAKIDDRKNVESRHRCNQRLSSPTAVASSSAVYNNNNNIIVRNHNENNLDVCQVTADAARQAYGLCNDVSDHSSNSGMQISSSPHNTSVYPCSAPSHCAFDDNCSRPKSLLIKEEAGLFVSCAEMQPPSLHMEEVLYGFPLDNKRFSVPYPHQRMSSWAKAKQLPVESLMHIYGQNFPIEARHVLAQWIEDQAWVEFDETDSQNEAYASQLLSDMVKLLEEKASELSHDFLLSLKLQEMPNRFRELYGNQPLNFVREVKNCLSREQSLIQQAENPLCGLQDHAMDTGPQKYIAQQLDYVHRYTQETESVVKELQHKQESFIIQFQANTTLDMHLQRLLQEMNSPARIEKEKQLRKQKDVVSHQLCEKVKEILALRVSLADKHVSTFQLMTEIQKKVLDEELIKWKRRQQLAANGAIFEGSLELLQHWCESLAELIWLNRQQVKKVQLQRQQLPINMPPDQIDLVPQLDQTITALLSALVTSTFIVETQPPQVLKKDSRFLATVCLLVGGKLNVHMNPPQVKASVISEMQARSLLKNEHRVKIEPCGDILNDTGTMEYHQATGQLSITFRNMQLKKYRRADKKGTEAVTEEKFCILFQSEFNLGGGELIFQVWTLSLPTVITVHGNQECNALGTVLWDNAFAEPGRVPFQVPDAVLWPHAAEMLSCKFKAATGRRLNRENMNYLATKLFGGNVTDDFSTKMLTWTQFNKDQLPGRSFTFWDWFYAILKLTKEHLKGPWNDGSIIGFISKNQAQEWLMSKQSGTFLLRFSDGVGGISIAWTEYGEKTWNLAPFLAQDFRIRSLANRIRDLSQLVYLYPDTNKDDAFEKYYSKEQDAVPGNGYVPLTLVQAMPSHQPTAALMNVDNPQTPQHPNPHSPSANSIYDSMPGSANSYENMTNGINMDGITEAGCIDELVSMTDYNPEDIDQINVNDLLRTCRPSQ